MNILTRLSLASIIASFGALTAPRGFPIQRHQTPPKPRYGSVKRQRRHADKQRARRRAKRLNHY